MIEYKIDSIATAEWKMSYATFGHGKQPFVLLPGLSLRPVTPMAQAVAMQYRAFHDDYIIHLIDRRSDIPDGYTIEQMAHDTATAMTTLGITNACVMGCSQGGMIAQIIASRYPHLVKKLVLCNTASHPSAMSTRVVSRWIELAQEGDVAALNRDVFAHVYSQAYYKKHAQAFALAEKIGSSEDMERFARLAMATCGYDLRAEQQNIKCPTLVVGSKIDNVLGAESSVELSTALNCELIMYAEYGHAAFDEAPDLHRRLLRFLANNESAKTEKRIGE